MEYTAEDLIREHQEEVCRETADAMILGERWDDYYGFDCDNYDEYDPFAE